MRSFLWKNPSAQSSPLKTLLLLLAAVTAVYLLLSHHLPPDLPSLHAHNHQLQPTPQPPPQPPIPTTAGHLLFSIASSSQTLQVRKPYIRLWHRDLRAYLFLDRPVSDPDPDLPPVVISADTSRFPYTYPRGLRSAIRVARIVKEAVELNQSGVRWYVFGDDDTVFFVENLVKVLSKYDHKRWFYVGGWSESYEQNEKYSFGMAFGGGGFAISESLGEVLAKVLDSCLMRYGHLYGSDARVYSCVAELGVELTREPGFHQVDIRGNLLGMLLAHPLSPLLSLHHVDAVDPIFPNMNKADAMEQLFKAAHVDQNRILQQTVCYDNSNSLTISISWGYAVQVYEGNVSLPNLLPLQNTFTPWRRNKNGNATHYMFNTRAYPKEPCKRPAMFFLQNVAPDSSGILTYNKSRGRNCLNNAINGLRQIRVFSKKLELDTEELKSPRRQCCDIHSFSMDTMVIDIRHCGINELISMQQ